MKISQCGAKTFNKTCSFEVDIGLWSLILNISSKKIPVIAVSWKFINMEPRYFTKHAVLKLAYGCCPSFWSSHQKNPCYRSLVKFCWHGAVIFHKTSHFEVSIGLCPSFWSSHQRNPCYSSLTKIGQHGTKLFNKMCSVEVNIWILPLISIVSSRVITTSELRSTRPKSVPLLATRCHWGYIWAQVNWIQISTSLGH